MKVLVGNEASVCYTKLINQFFLPLGIFDRMTSKKNVKKRVIARNNKNFNSNVIFLIINTALVSLGGFLFWVNVVKNYQTADVGIAAAIIAIISLIVHISLLGLNFTLIRLLPKSTKKNTLISLSLSIIGITAFLFAALILLIIPVVAPALAFLREWPTLIYFVIFAITVSLDMFSESIFLAFRSWRFILLRNFLILIAKIILPYLFRDFGPIGIFVSWTLASTGALFVSFTILFKKFHFRFISDIKKSFFDRLINLSTIDFALSILIIAPNVLLPVLVLSTLSYQNAAYFYMPFMIASILYSIPFITTQLFFPATSYSHQYFLQNVRKTIKYLFILVIPTILLLIVLSNYILLFFGITYSVEGVRLLQILVLAGIPVSLNYLGLHICRMKGLQQQLIVINIFGLSLLTYLTYLLSIYSLEGIGLSWLLVQIVMNILYGSVIAYNLAKRNVTLWLKNGLLKLQYFSARIRGVFIGFHPSSFTKRIYVMSECKFDYPNKIQFGHNIIIHQNVTFSTPYGIQIGNFVVIDQHCSFASTPYGFEDWKKPMMLQDFAEKPIVIEDDVVIGAHSLIYSGVHIKRGAVITPGSVVTKDVSSYAIVGGAPARVLRYRFDKKTIMKAKKVKFKKVSEDTSKKLLN